MEIGVIADWREMQPGGNGDGREKSVYQETQGAPSGSAAIDQGYFKFGEPEDHFAHCCTLIRVVSLLPLSANDLLFGTEFV